MKPVRLAFSGSGFLAGIHAGAASALLDAGYEIVEVAGTSGGSICAAALALGFDSKALYQLSVCSDMSGLLDCGLFTFLRSGALDSGSALLAWLENNVTKGTCLKDAKIPIQILATDVRAKTSFTFSRDETPDVPLALACRASSAVPLVYAPVIYQGRFLADGGMVANIPVDRLFADGTPRIGVDVADSGESKTSPLTAYLGTLIHLLLAANEDTEIHLAANTGAKVIRVPTQENPLDTGLSQTAKNALYHAGYVAMTKIIPTL